MTSSRTTVIRRARVLGRHGVTGEQTVAVVDGTIAYVGAGPVPDSVVEPAGVTVAGVLDVDATGGVLLPGLIDAHAHVDGPQALDEYARWGVTTVLDMGSRDPSDASRHVGPRRPGVLGAGVPATARGGMHTRTMGFPAASEVLGVEDAARFVRERVSTGAHFVKVVVEDPKVPGTKALPPATIAALVEHSHAAGKIVVAHVVTLHALEIADDAGVDVVTHTPLDGTPSVERMEALAGRGVVLVPTLTMMDDAATSITGRLMFRILMALRIAPRLDYRHAQGLVRMFHDRGLTVLAGTDANTEPLVPARPAYGSSLHDELSRLVAAGLTATQALWAATGATAEVFALHDRGQVEVGRRGDLMLVGADPTLDITAARDVRGVWIDGHRVCTEQERPVRPRRRRPMILVTAAAGNQGRHLVPRLLAAGHDVRACVQSTASADRLRSFGVQDVVVGDLADPAVVRRAVSGVEKVYHVGPTIHPRERAMGLDVVDAARAEGVRHLVFSSVLHAITTDLVQHEIKRDIEEHLLSSGLEFTILQPANYMLPLKLRPVFERGVFELSWSLERRQSLVDLGDVADVAALVLGDTAAHAGATYELAAPGRYTATDLGAILSTVLRHPVEVRRIDADTYLRAWVGDGDPAQFPHQLRVLRAITARYSSHDFVGNPNVLTWLLGRPPTSFEAFVEREHAAYRDGRREPAS